MATTVYEAIKPDAPLIEGDPIGSVIDQAIEADLELQRPRGHLGMSQIGKKDKRTLWLNFRWCLPVEHTARTERIFRLGDAIELELSRYTRMIPDVKLHTTDSNGDQFRVSDHGGHFGGSLDGAILGVPTAEKTWHVWEAKSVSDKRFKDLKKKGVMKWSPEYYAQLQCYMGKTGMERALFCAYNKDTSELYFERVRFDEIEYASLMVKALDIIEADAPPASSFKDRSWYEAKWMAPVTSAVYWGDRLPPKANCRNCRFSKPIIDEDGAQWGCWNGEQLLPLSIDAQWKGCLGHQWIPELFPGVLLNSDQYAQEFKLDDDRIIVNGSDGYNSQELAELSKTNFKLIDDTSGAIRQEFDGQVAHVEDPLKPSKGDLF